MTRPLALLAAVVACNDCPEPPEEIDGGYVMTSCAGGCCAYEAKSCDTNGQCRVCSIPVCQTACGEWEEHHDRATCGPWQDDAAAPCRTVEAPVTHLNATRQEPCSSERRACCTYRDVDDCEHTLCQQECGYWSWPDTVIMCP